MAWADRATLILGLFWAPFVFMMMGGATRTDITLGTYLQIYALCLLIPLGFVWILLRLILGNRGSIRRY